MEKNNLFQIGTISKMFNISVGTLRHYEKLNLIKPEYIDTDSNYRYYSSYQFEILNTIRYLRTLDMSLNDIKEFLQNRDIELIEKKLLSQKEQIKEKQKILESIEKKIDYRIKQIRDAKNSELDVIDIKEFPKMKITWIKDNFNNRSVHDIEVAIRKLVDNQKNEMIFLGKIGFGISKENLLIKNIETYNCIFMVLDEEDKYSGDIINIESQICVSIRYKGSHEEAGKYYEKLLNYINENKMSIIGFSKEITMIDEGLTSDREKHVTEIRIPVKL